MYSGTKLKDWEDRMIFDWKIFVDGKFKSEGTEKTTRKEMIEVIEKRKDEGFESRNCYLLDGSIEVYMTHGRTLNISTCKLVGTFKQLQS